MKFKYNTGGREKYYKKINVRDCATRAIAIANNMDYKEVYELMWEYQGKSPRNGVSQDTTNNCLNDLGWEYINIEQEFKRINDFEIQKEKLILRLKMKANTTHTVAYINGIINDTWNCSKDNPRVLGYWRRI